MRREVMGFWFDPENGKFWDDEFEGKVVSNFTFNDLWYISTSPLSKPTQPLNPFYAPTKETAEKVFAWAQQAVGFHAQLRLVQEPIKQNPYGRFNFPEWSIYAEKTNFEGEGDPLSVGLIASSLIRNPGPWPARSLEAQLRAQGAWA